MPVAEVKFIKYHPQFAHDVDDVVELRAQDAAMLIEAGYAVPTKSVPVETTSLQPTTETATVATKQARPKK